jgi:hypothetical protein
MDKGGRAHTVDGACLSFFTKEIRPHSGKEKREIEKELGPGYETKMKLRKLEELLDDVEAFPKPKVKLEQYPTSPHIAYACSYQYINNPWSIEEQLRVGRTWCTQSPTPTTR